MALCACNEPLQKQPENKLFSPILANGFDFAVGDKNGKGSYTAPSGKIYNGWYIAVKTAQSYSMGIHTGEDWNGNGGGDTDLGQPVYAVAKGVVLHADDYGFPWGNVVVVEHYYLENAKVKTCRSLYAHLDDYRVSVGDTLEKRTPIGTIGTGNGAYPAHLHLEIRKPSMNNYAVTYWPSSNDKDSDWVREHYFSPSDFIQEHRTCDLPKEKDVLVVATKSDMMIRIFEKGKLQHSYNMAVGQNPVGHKQQQGDNRTPEGAYRIIQKSKGPFSGSMADFFGVAWMRISYPNAYDAHAGYENKRINSTQRDQIIKNTKRGIEPPKNTKLGGGIGIHGWAGEWDPDETRGLTWGCISINNSDLEQFYDQVPLNTEIYILP